MRRVWIPLWMAAFALVSCAELDPAPTATSEQLAAVTAAPTLAAEPTATRVPSRVPEGGPPVIPQALMPASSGSSWTPNYDGRRSLEMNILGADVIARVTLSSTATSTVQEAPNEYGQIYWLVLLEFRFTVHEYLKGTGGNKVSGLVYRSFGYEEDARAAEAVIADAHDARWDDREAVVFLSLRDYWLEPDYQLGDGQYWFGPMFRRTSDAGLNDAYTVSSIHNNLWLPEDEPAAQGRRSRAEKTYLLDVPAGTQTRAATGATRVSGPPNTPDPPPVSEITLSDLKSKIATLEAEANAGGTDAYYQCIRVNYAYENGLRYDTLRGFSNVINSTSTIGSGLPEGAFVYDYRDAETPSKEFVPQMGWFEGATKDLVRFDNVDFRTGGRYGWRFTHNIVTARPLPAGSYRLYPLTTGHLGVACSFPDAGRNLHFHDLTVTAPAGTLHEAFFDPVGIGAAVGADGTNGVLEPAAFTVGGASATITSLKWESGTATMVLSPSASLAGHAVDFIALDGSVTSTLAFDDATQSGGTLTWSVPDKPWNAGDLLMLRIAAKPSIAISGLDASIEAGQSDDFTVSASNMATTTSYGIRVTTDDSDIGFDGACADRHQDTTVTEASTSASAAFTLHACGTPGGTVTATLMQGATAVATTTRDVTVTAPPPPPPHAPAPAGLSVDSSTETSLSVSWNTVQDSYRYKLERSPSGTSGWSRVVIIGGTSHTLSGLSCATTVHFRVSARGDGSPYSTTFGAPSTASVSGTTSDCTATTTPVSTPTPVSTTTTPSPPVFAPKPYSFTVSENASAFHSVGTVSAVDPDGGIVTYSIVAGNGDGKFKITRNAGLIVVWGALDYDATASYALTVRATDTSGATSTVTVNISITEVP